MSQPDPIPADPLAEQTPPSAPPAGSARPPAVVFGIIAICILAEIAIVAADSGLTNNPRLRDTIYEFGGFWPGLLDGWRENYPGQRFAMFLTYGFLHGGVLHLAMNMYTLWVLSIPITERAGTSGFIQIYVGSILGGAIGYATLSSSPVPMVGASGALFGLAGALVAWILQDLRGAELRRTLIRISAYLIGVNVAMYWALDGRLAWQTHLGGFVAGLMLALFLGNLPPPTEPDPTAAPDSSDDR